MSEAILIQGKHVAIVPEETYIHSGQACPHCKSVRQQKYLSDCKEADGDLMADVLLCEDCTKVLVVVSHPRIHMAGAIILNWQLTEKGVMKYGTQREEAQSEPSGEAGGTGTGTSAVSGPKGNSTDAEDEAAICG